MGLLPRARHPSAPSVGLLAAAVAASVLGCANGASPRVVSVAASSGPRPHVEVTVADDASGRVGAQRLDVYEVRADGLALRARLDALTLLGVAAASAGEVAAFRAYEAGDQRRVHAGLVAPRTADDRDAGDADHAGALLQTRDGYVGAAARRMVGLDARGARRWATELPPVPPGCPRVPDDDHTAPPGDALERLDVQVSPSGRWVCVARTAMPRAPCAIARAQTMLLDSTGTIARSGDEQSWRPGGAGAAQCAVRDDGSVLALLPSSGAGVVTSAARLRSLDGVERRLPTVAGAAVDVAPAGDRWVALLHSPPDRAAAPWLLGDGRSGQRRLLPPGDHALVPIASAVLVVSVSGDDRSALDVAAFDRSGGHLFAQRVELEGRGPTAD